jgi:hypothetical protein
MDLFAPKRALPPGHLDDLKALVRQKFNLSELETVTLIELRCTEPDCPPLETVVGILSASGNRQFKVHKALAELTAEDIHQISA